MNTELHLYFIIRTSNMLNVVKGKSTE